MSSKAGEPCQLGGEEMLSRAGLHNQYFVICETMRSLSTAERKWRILFSSRPTWETSIANGFRFTPHEVTFAELSQEAIARHDLVVPLTLEALKSLDSRRHFLTRNPIPIPSLQSVAICNDKDRFNRTLIEAGFGKFIPSIESKLQYPYILKKRVDEWSANSFIVRNPQDEEMFAEKLASPDYFRQTFVPGNSEYATHVVFKGGRIVCSLNVRYVFAGQMPIKGHDKPLYSEVCDFPYDEAFSAILKCVGFEGLCCFNYKIVDGRPYILELNPRFGGSLAPYFFSFIRLLQRETPLLSGNVLQSLG